jgi:hypothetical protein
MDPKTSRVALTQIAILEQAIEETPAHSAADVSKGRAIGMLAPKLHAMRAKGYTWRDIAAWLTEHGVAVTPSALQRGLRSVKVTHRERASAPGKRSASVVESRTGAVPVRSSSPTTTAAPPAGLPRSANTAALAPGEASARPVSQTRAGFTPRPDTKDI